MTARATNRARLLGIVVVSLVIAVAWLRSDVPTSAGASKVVVPPGVVFEDPPAESQVTLGAAISTAGGRQPDAWAYVLMTNPNVGPGLVPGLGPDGMVRRPVYVLQYENVEAPLFGPSVDTAASAVPGTLQVYVDADTGTPLYARSVAALTP